MKQVLNMACHLVSMKLGATLFMEDSHDVGTFNTIVEITSLPRDQWLDDNTSIHTMARRLGKELVTWSQDDYDLYTWRGFQEAMRKKPILVGQLPCSDCKALRGKRYNLSLFGNMASKAPGAGDWNVGFDGDRLLGGASGR